MAFRVKYNSDLLVKGVIKDIVVSNVIELLDIAVYDPSIISYDNPADVFTIPADEFFDTPLNKLSSYYCSSNDVIAVCSTVYPDADNKLMELHIPQIDFCCPKSRLNRKEALAVLRKMNQNDGYILETDNSYHYYGRNLLQKHEWEQYMRRLYNFSIVGFWAEQCKRNGYSALRISSNKNKPTIPSVIARIYPQDTVNMQLMLFEHGLSA